MKEKCPQKFIQSRKKKKKGKPARLKTQKGGLGKSQGQRKKEKKRKEACQAENLKGQSRQKLGPKKRRKRKEELENPTKLET